MIEYKPNTEHWLETYKSLITISLEGFKFILFTNGGAAIALLAYLGNIAGKGVPIPDMTCPIMCYIVGICSGFLAMFFSYFTQLALLNENINKEVLRSSHLIPLSVAAIFFFIGVAMFFTGSMLAVKAFPGTQ